MFLNKLKDISTLIFDVDGVLTDGSVFVTEAGDQCRTFNTKDGYALQLAVKCGYRVCVITGGKSQGVILRLNSLGVTDIFSGAQVKTEIFANYMAEHKLQPTNVMYVGDDIPDLEVMKLVGLAACPADAVPEIKAVAHYISPALGGRGCVRDVIEKVLKVRGHWMKENATSL